MFPNSLRYIAPLFPSRILSPLLPSLRLPSFNFLSLRFIDSYGFSRNYHEIPYNYEQKYEQKLIITKNVPKIPFDQQHESHDFIQNPKENKNKKQNKNENCNGEPMLQKNRNNDYLIDKHFQLFTRILNNDNL